MIVVVRIERVIPVTKRKSGFPPMVAPKRVVKIFQSEADYQIESVRETTKEPSVYHLCLLNWEKRVYVFHEGGSDQESASSIALRCINHAHEINCISHMGVLLRI